jgi:DNA-binding response OmpR family regulator
MSLKSLLLSSDEKTVRVLRRVLSDLEIDLEHSATSEDVIRKITRSRFEAIIVDCIDPDAAGNVFRAAKAAPVNKRALSIVLVDAPVGLKGGFDMGAHFVLHKPLAVERAKSSFRAVRALMKSERRVQMRIPVQIPVECVGSGRYPAKTLDLCEGGMAIRFTGRKAKEKLLRFSLTLPGTDQVMELWGGIAWEGTEGQVGIRFQDATEDQRNQLRSWLKGQLPEPETDDPPVLCRLTELSAGGCYLSTNAPFPKSARVIISLKPAGLENHASGIVRLAHPEYGMGVEFLQATTEQGHQVKHLVEALLSMGESPEVSVEPDGLDATPSDEPSPSHAANDALVGLFRHHANLSLDDFLQQMKQKRHAKSAH